MNSCIVGDDVRSLIIAATTKRSETPHVVSYNLIHPLGDPGVRGSSTPLAAEY